MSLFTHYMGDLHLVLPALNLSILDAGILKKEQHGSLMIFSLNMVDYPKSILSPKIILAGRQVEGTILSKFYSLGLVAGPLLHALKLKGGWWWWWPTGF